VRVIVVAAILSLLSLRVEASKALDITEIRGARSVAFGYDEIPNPIVPSHPSLFVHVGSDGPSEMPLFATPDGQPIRIANVTSIQSSDHGWNLKRIDLDIETGEIVVRYPGKAIPVARYTVDPSFTPKTRTVEVRPAGITLWIDSDAVVFRVDDRNIYPDQFNNARVYVSTGRRQRITALYPNGTEEVIYDGVPTDRREREEKRGIRTRPGELPLWPLAIVMLLLALGAWARYATPKAD
jgi:hypothetical protein